MGIPKKKNSQKNTSNPSLSSSEIKYMITKKDVEDIHKKVFDAVNELELQKSLDKWLKDNKQHQQVAMRDLGLLKAIITEYLDSFILFGYNNIIILCRSEFVCLRARIFFHKRTHYMSNSDTFPI